MSIGFSFPFNTHYSSLSVRSYWGVRLLYEHKLDVYTSCKCVVVATIFIYCVQSQRRRYPRISASHS
jgi:hypothetical protein